MSWFSSAYNLVRNFNCATATGKACRERLCEINGDMFGAIAGLEGGVASCGSTCGVLSVGVFCIALEQEEQITSGEVSEDEVMEICRDYLDWFEGKYDATLCRERTGISFWKTSGFIRYLLPGDKVVKCVNHLNAATNYLAEAGWQNKITDGKKNKLNKQAKKQNEDCIHCATEVLKRVRDKTGVGVARLERLSFVFDGGVALTGGACGALIAAVLDIKLMTGSNPERLSFAGAARDFIDGHGNSKSVKKRGDHSLTRALAEEFIEKTGSSECGKLVGRKFANYDEFCRHMENSKKCSDIIDLCVDETLKVIEEYQR